MANKDTNTKKPKGLSIKRKDNKFTFSWKTGEKYERQSLEYRIKKNGKWEKKWTAVKGIKAGTTHKTITRSINGFVPNTGKNVRFDAIAFHVKAKAPKKSWCGWVEEAHKIGYPKNPSISAELKETNQTKFSWSVADSDNKSWAWATKITVDTTLVTNGGATYPSKANWQTLKNGTPFSGSYDNPENTALDGWLTSKSYTRWVVARAWGPHGNSELKTNKHIYAKPKEPKVTSKSVAIANKSEVPLGVTNVTVKWNTNNSNAYPVDSCSVEYMIGTPAADMTVPSGSWSTAPAGTVKDPDAASHTFSINDRPTTDQCMWVRVVNKHDEITTPGPAAWAFNGPLGTPTISDDVYVDPTTKRATVKITHGSSVPDSYVSLYYINSEDPKKTYCWLTAYEHNETEKSGIELSGWNGSDNITFAARAYAKPKNNVDAWMASDYFVLPRYVPLPPRIIELTQGSVDGTAHIEWEWNWDDATAIEISWADHEDAWESTDEPQTYVVNNTKAASWNISGLSVGTVWYIRLRFMAVVGETTVYGVYSSIQAGTLNLTSAPTTPSLELIPNYVSVDGSLTAAWGYTSTDGTPQMAAEIAEVTTVNGETVYTRIAETETAQHVLITPSTIQPESVRETWTTGSVHALALRLKSGSQVESDWSVPKNVTVLDPVTVAVTSTPFVSRTIVIDDDTEETRVDDNSLVAMPFSLTVTGAGANGTTMVSIIRAEPYLMPRPDDTEYGGVEGETILSYSQIGEDEITITNDGNMLVGYLDDGAPYRLIATVVDEYGQSATIDPPIDFIVHWDHQAKIPDGEVIIDEENDIAILTPIAPTVEEGEEWALAPGDVCDIYRLSTDRPELVVSDAVWGTQYVDPYPAIGENGGYRFVFRTENNDFITAQNEVAWTDIDAGLNILNNIIDFGNDRADLIWNVDLSSAWKKDFKETQYLGGSVVGDWNPAVSRTGSVTGVVIKAEDNATIMAMRRLATHAGICHVRTVDGSSYAADVQVSESRGHEPSDLTVSFTLNVTRVDTEEPDGMLYSDWLEENETEEEE